MKELKLDFRKMNTDDARKKYYVEVKSIRSSEINYDKTDTKASNRPTNLKDKFEQCLKESGERQEIQNEWMKKITTIKRRILEENKEPTTTHDKPKQQLQKLVSHDINDLPTSYSATLQSKLPPKETDPGSFILPCIIENHSMSNALADLGASISVMAIEMADRSMQSPKGIKENVLVKITNFVFPVDFIVLDTMKDENVLIILGRPMLATAHAKIDVYSKKISLGVGNDQVVFNINKRESPASISPICVINEFDKTQEFDSLGDFENYVSPEYGSQDIISLSPLESTKIKEDFSMTPCDPDKRMSIGLEDFVNIDGIWDDLDPWILTYEEAKTEFLKSGGRIHLHNPDNLQFFCKIGFVNFNPYVEPQTPFKIMSRKAYNTVMKQELVYSRINMVGLDKNLHVFIENHQFLVGYIILENINEFVEKGLTEVLFGRPFKEQIGLVKDR
ncbi:homeodomain-like protein, partial [Tanacetum coccineum]